MPNESGPSAAIQLQATARQDGATIPFFYGFCVWGKAYTDLLCDVALPCLLSPHNLPAMPNNAVSRLVIATTPADEAAIRRHPVFAALTAIIACEFQHLPDPETYPANAGYPKKYQLMMLGHSMVVKLALGRACAVMLGPDAAHTDGMLPFLLAKVREGYHSVVSHGLRVNKESLLDELRLNYGAGSGAALTLKPREAVRLLLKHEHEDTKIQHWDDPNFPDDPGMCVWASARRDGLLVRTFTLHPYILDYREPVDGQILPSESTPIDGTFLVHSFVPWRKIYMVADSDDFVVLSLTAEAERDYGRDALRDPYVSLCQSASRIGYDILHRANFMHALRFHAADLDAGWDSLERGSIRLSYSIMAAAQRATRWKSEDMVIWDPEFEARFKALQHVSQAAYTGEFAEVMRSGTLTAWLKLQRYQFALPLLKPTDHVLEIGASTGTGSMFLARYCGQVTALETRPVDHALAVAINNRPNLTFQLQSILDYRAEQKHDAVVALDSCEDVGAADLDRLIAAMSRQLEPEGWLLIGAPNISVRRLQDAATGTGSPIAPIGAENLRLLVARHFREAQICRPERTPTPTIGWYYFVLAKGPRLAG